MGSTGECQFELESAKYGEEQKIEVQVWMSQGQNQKEISRRISLGEYRYPQIQGC